MYAAQSLKISLFLSLFGLFAFSSIAQKMNAKDWYKMGLSNLQPQEKIAAFSAAIAQKTEWAEAYLQRGLVQLNQQVFLAAEIDFDAAITYQKKYEEAYYYRGLARYYQEKCTQAIADFDSALLFNKKYIEPIHGKALAETKLKQYESAIRHFSDVIVLNPDSAYKYLTDRGIAYYLLQDKKAALQDFQAAISLKSDYYLPHFYKGMLRKLTEPKEALQDFSKAVLCRPSLWEGFYEKANIESALGRENEAIDDYSEMIALLKKPKTIAEKKAKAAAYFSRGLRTQELKNAQQLTRNVVADMDSCLLWDRSKDSAFLIKGLIHFAEKKYTSSLIDFSEVIRLNAQSTVAWDYKMQALYQLKDYTQLLAEVDKALLIQPKNEGLHLLKAQSAYTLQQYSKAIQAFDAYLKIAKTDAVAFYQRGVSHQNLKNYAQALADFTNTILLQKDHIPAYLARGKLYFQQKKYADAISDFDAVLLLKGGCGEVYHLRAEAKKALSDEKGAIADYLAEIKCGDWKNNIDKGAAFTNLGLMLYEQEDYENAVKYLYMASRYNPKNGDIFYHRGMAENELGRFAAAKKSLDTLAMLQPDLTADAMQTRGLLNYQQGNYAGAISGFEQVLEKSPNNVTALFHKALSEIKLNQKEEALRDLNQVIDQNPLHNEAYQQRAQLFMEQNDFEKALPDLQKVIAANPASAEAYMNLVKIYLAKKDWDAAQNSLTNLLALDANSYQAYTYKAAINKHLLRYSEAQENINKALSINPNYSEAHFYQGQLQYDFGKYSEALASFSRAIQNANNPEASYYYQRALAYSALGQAANAVTDLDRALALQPNFPEAVEKRKIEKLK